MWKGLGDWTQKDRPITGRFCTATEENLLAGISFGVVDVKKNEALEAWMELPTASPTTTLKVLYLANLCISRILN